MNQNNKTQISIILSQDLHFTVTLFPASLTNLLEPQSGQIGQARTGSINVV